ncbi:lytic transglycosylase [Streptomyces piniterrae]|uniref:Lytic transglycosylase n=1 Tax=Streptomyces piniterrae TaxID=2571125 RepID=A0A4U0NM06_9ACTN|nr:lytic transglycosylase [Streptomyces piniterrae]TJZ51054.1 lytic transglycosylase [Streptomyces piniterrae]
MAATFRRRLLRGAASTVVVALALAALTASQSPGAAEAAGEHDPVTPATDTPIDGGSTYYTDLPPLNSPVPPGSSGRKSGDGDGDGGPIATGPAEAGIPASVLAAYKSAAARIAETDPGCRLPWQLLAGIGKVESGQAAGGAVDSRGTTLRPILGPQLNGHGFARITDTDGGRYDGDLTHDRAVGPMQFIPSTWSNGGPDGAGWGTDGNGDGKKDPNNVFDAALAAGRYLCNGGRDLTTRHDLDHAILGYNNSTEYLRTVLSWYAFYRKGTHEVPDGKGVLPVHRTGSRADGGRNGRGEGAGAHHGERADQRHEPGKAAGKPAKPSRPGKPGKPGRPGKPNEPGEPDGGNPPKPTPDPANPSPTTPAPKPPAHPAPLTALERTGDQHLTAAAGAEFAASPQVKAKDATGKPVVGAPVRFLVTGSTHARFPDGTTTVTVTTDNAGLATAPKLQAGDRAGAFTVRAETEGRTVPAVDFAMTVQAAQSAPKADALVRTSDKKLTATAGGAFAADAVEIKATYHGRAAAGVAVTATMVTDDPKCSAECAENDKGPYFKNPEPVRDPEHAGNREPATDSEKVTKPGATAADPNEPVRTLTTLTTDGNGLLKLPKIYTDTHTGTFLLRLTTADGAVLTIKLNVTAPAAT